MDDEVLEELRRLREEVAKLNRNFERLDLEERRDADAGRGPGTDPSTRGGATGRSDDRPNQADSGRARRDDPRGQPHEQRPNDRTEPGRDGASDHRDAGAPDGHAAPGTDVPPGERDEFRTPDPHARSGDAPEDPERPHDAPDGPHDAPDGSHGAPDGTDDAPKRSRDEPGRPHDAPERTPDAGASEHGTAAPGAQPAGAGGGAGHGRGGQPAETPGSPTAGAAGAGTGDPGPADSGSGRDWERSVGTKWLGIVGVLALVLGVVFFARVAIDRGLIGPLGRVALGTLGGLGLVGVGRYAGRRPDYRRWGQIASGGGLAVAYFSVYAAHGVDHYREAIGAPPVLVVLGLTALIVGAVAVSVREREPLFAGEAFLLGYVTTIVAPEVGTSLLTPAYLVLLTAALVTVSVYRNWDYYVALGVLPAYLSLLAWTASTEADAAVEVAAIGAIYLSYVAGGYALDRQERDDQLFAIQRVSTTVANAGFATIFLEVNARDLTEAVDLAGAGTGAVAASLVAVYAVTLQRPARRNDAAGILAVLLAALAVPIAFGTFGTTVGLLAVVCGAVALAHYLDGVALRTTAHVVAAVALFQIVFYASWDLPQIDLGDPAAALTSRAVALGAAAVVFYGLAWLWDRTEPDHLLRSERDVTLVAPYTLSGTGLAVLVLGLELSGSWITLGWALLGLALVGVGLLRSERGLRLQGVAVLALATLKVFVFDTADLDLLARTASFLVLGAILLATSYAYARWLGEDPLVGISEE